jgi:hypothetical protein
MALRRDVKRQGWEPVRVGDFPVFIEPSYVFEGRRRRPSGGAIIHLPDQVIHVPPGIDPAAYLVGVRPDLAEIYQNMGCSDYRFKRRGRGNYKHDRYVVSGRRYPARR